MTTENIANEDISVETASGIARFSASTDVVFDDETIAKYVGNIRDCVSKTGSHSFGESGEHILKFVCLDSSGNVRGFSTTCRDDPRGGRVLVRKAKDLRDFLSVTHDQMPADVMGTVAAAVYCAPLAPECILAFPPQATSPKLLRALGISRCVELRLSDGKGLGKSTPRFSETKFKHLVPTAPDNVRKTASKAALPPPPSKRKRDVHEFLTRRVSASKALEGDEREVALKMLNAFKDHAEDYFDELFEPLCELTFEACAIAVANRKFMKAMVGGIDSENSVIIDALSDYYDHA